MGMSMVADAAKNAGHEVYLYDFLVNGTDLAELQKTASEFAPDYICVSVRNLDDEIDYDYSESNHEKFTAYGSIISKIKETTGAAVIIGGAAVSLMPKQLGELLFADYVIKGEGEQAFCNLLETIESGVKPEWLIDGKDYPFDGFYSSGVMYDHDLVKAYYDKSGHINIQTKRGCPFDCAYCTYPAIEGKNFRFRSAEVIVDDMKRLRSDYGCRSFFFTDSVFNDPAGKFRLVAEELIKADLDIQWAAYLSPYMLEKSDVELMKRSGMYAVEFGTDASNDVALAGMNKRFTWGDVIKANDYVVDAGLPCAHYVIFGGPDEDYDSAAIGIENCKAIRKSVFFGFIGVRLYWGTPACQYALNAGLVDQDDSLFEAKYYVSEKVEQGKLDEMIKAGWANELRLMYPPTKARNLSDTVKKAYGCKGLIWDMMC